MIIYLRSRQVLTPSNDTKSFLEFYVHYHNGKLSWPMDHIERFEKRILFDIGQFDYDLNRPLGPNFEHGILGSYEDYQDALKNNYVPAYNLKTLHVNVYGVHSNGSGPSKRTFEDITRDGVWITYNDSVPRGGTPTGYDQLGYTVWPKAVFMGLQIDSIVHRTLYSILPDIYKIAYSHGFVCNLKDDPKIFYHGTARDLTLQILEQGFMPTFGMFGHAVYFGSFWKAFRFATMTQDYQKRPGSILRCFAFLSKTPHFREYRNKDPCKCEECQRSSRRDPLADHLGLWQYFSDHVVAYPENGSWLKNEEYAVSNGQKIVIDTIGHAEAQTEHHEPWNRNLHIL